MVTLLKLSMGNRKQAAATAAAAAAAATAAAAVRLCIQGGKKNMQTFRHVDGRGHVCMSAQCLENFPAEVPDRQ